MTWAHLEFNQCIELLSTFDDNAISILTVIAKVQLLNVPCPGDVLTQADAHKNDEQADGRVQQKVDDVPGAGIALKQRRQVHVGHVDAHCTDALLRCVVPPRLP